jgi:zinc transport system substrate-binding protein
MKKAAFALVAVWLGAALAQTPLPVVATTEILADMLRQVGGSRVKVSVLVPRSADPHSFDPRPSAVLAATRARLVVANGLDLEPFFEALEAQLPPSVRVLELANDQPNLIATEDDHKAAEADHDHDHGAYDPHLWLDPAYGIRYVEKIRDVLVKLDPAGKASYQQNVDRYVLQIRQADTRVRQCLKDIPVSRRKVVTQHQALAYFARTYQIKLVGSLANYAGQERGAQQLASLVKTMKQQGVKAILAEPQFNPAQVKVLAESTGAQVVRVYADAFDDRVNTYLGLVEANGLTVCAALK